MSENPIKFEGPARYKIRIQGRLSPSMRTRIGATDFEEELINERNIISAVKFDAPDQASLSGILNAIYDMHLSIISVESIDEDK